MAEAGVGVQSNTGRFFCHKCNEELSHVLEDFTCPKCKAGFVEKLSDVPPPNPSNSATGVGGAEALGVPFLEFLAGLTQSEINPSGMVYSGQSSRSNTGAGSGARTPEMNFSFLMDVRPQRGNQAGRVGGTQQNAPGQNPQQQQQANPNANPMEHMLFSFLNDLITGLSGGGVTVGGGFPMITNLGDYVWGRDGLDAIVTQLMNQMEGTGPPPMPSEKIDTLPTVKINQEQVDRKLQCSVCWDDFQLGEDVKQLECEHLYHSDCIVPWLKLHGTCPICRKDLTNAEDANATPSARFEPPQSGGGSRSDDNLGRPRDQGGRGPFGRGNDDLDRMENEFD